MNLLSFAASTISGLLLCGIGLIGLTDMPARPVSQLTVLLEPTGFGKKADTAYLAAISFVGVWLVLSVWARLAAMAGMVLILSKIVLHHGMLALALTIALCVLVAAAIALRTRGSE
ncbi:hypothetical protein [Yoonia sp.]|uniref:hypothetical protein n=1 Tax=Yoonia sp. TaxID=2212373 RepID=UPI003F6BF1DA